MEGETEGRGERGDGGRQREYQSEQRARTWAASGTQIQ
jgi:hypothetical protein